MSFSNAFMSRLQALKHSDGLLVARQARRIVGGLWPSLALKFNKTKRDALVREYNKCSSVADCMKFARQHTTHGSIQIAGEIESAINLLASKQPVIMCEIGTFDGGTSLLFNKLLPSVEVMICIDLYVKNKQLLRVLAPSSRKLQFFNGSSYSDCTINKVAKFLNGRMIDVLFIDGDHRYEGVKRDFLCYRGFVRDGGFIVFHDIVADKGKTSAWTGGVPKLWNELCSF
jgi:cephalosporin hydroxylase